MLFSRPRPSSAVRTWRRLSVRTTPVNNKTAMIVGRPLWRYALAVARPEPQMAPLIEAITALPSDRRPFRIVSHDVEDGRVFNSAFFDSTDHASAFLAWCVASTRQPHTRTPKPRRRCLRPRERDRRAVSVVVTTRRRQFRKATSSTCTLRPMARPMALRNLTLAGTTQTL